MMMRRSFSMSSAALNLVRPPIPVHGVEGRYAAALYSAAHKQKVLEAVEKDLKAIRDQLKTDKLFRDYLLNPAVKAAQKKNAMKSVAKKMGLSQTTENFFGVLADNHRMNKLSAMINSYESIMRAHRGELSVEVTTAEPLSAKQEQALAEVLKKFTPPGQSLQITKTVKPEIIGGVVVTIGDKYVDMSMASRMKKFEEVMKSAL